MSSTIPPPSHRTLVWVVSLLALPFIVGLGLHLSGWVPSSTVNHGQLINPPQAIVAPGPWPGKWSLVLLHDAPCGNTCRSRLDELRRLRLSLGRDMEQTQLIWLGVGVAPEVAALQRQIPDLAAVDAPAEPFSHLPPGSMLLVDPQGNAMLRYAPNAPADGIRADIERLLKYTWRS